MGASGSMNNGKGQQMPAMQYGQQGGGPSNYSTAFGQNAQQYGLQPQGMNAGKAGAMPQAWQNIARRQGDPNAGYGGGFDQSSIRQPTPYEFQQGTGGEWGRDPNAMAPPPGAPDWQQNQTMPNPLQKESLAKALGGMSGGLGQQLQANQQAGGQSGSAQAADQTMQMRNLMAAQGGNVRPGGQQTTGWGQSTGGGKGGMPPQGQQGGGPSNYSTAFGQAAQQGGLQGGGGKGGSPPPPQHATPGMFGDRLSMFTPQGGALSYGYGSQNPNAVNPLGSMGGGGNPNPFAQGNDAWAGGSQMAIPPMSGVAGQAPPPAAGGGPGGAGGAGAVPGVMAGTDPASLQRLAGQGSDATIARNFDALMKEDPSGAKARAYADMNTGWYQRNQMQVKDKYFGGDSNKRNQWTNTYAAGGYAGNQQGQAARKELEQRFGGPTSRAQQLALEKMYPDWRTKGVGY